MTCAREPGPDQAGIASNPTVLPEGLETMRHTPEFTAGTVPAALLKDHNTKLGTWGLIHVSEGMLRYDIAYSRRPPRTTFLTADSEPGIVEPTIRHRVVPIGATRFHLEFLREPA